MKQNILVAFVLLFFATSIQAQVIIKNENKEKIDLSDDKLVKIVFDSYDQESNGENFFFICESGDTLNLQMNEVHSFGFAEDYDKVEAITAMGQTAILYDAHAAIVYIVNPNEEESIIRIFNTDGKFVKSGKGTSLSIAELEEGLYIVNYNKELNAKIVKK